MPLILPGNVASATASTGYTVANSYRISANSSYLSRTPGSEGNRAKWTFSAWVKGGGLSGQQNLLNSFPESSNESRIYISSGRFGAYNWVSDATDGYYQTDALLRDPSAWYHVVFSWDSDNATAGDRIKMYINGTEQTSFSTEQDPGSGSDSFICDDAIHYVGRSGDPSANQSYYGYMAEVCLCDGQTYAASDFGEFDEDSPTIWKPKNVSGLTFGTTGFYLDFEDSADLGADVSGNSNDFTATSLDATHQATDTPTNNFCTMNPLYAATSSVFTFSQGNCIVEQNATAWRTAAGTIGLTSGKWYFEAKGGQGDNGYTHLGWATPQWLWERGVGNMNEPGATHTGPSYSYYGYNGRIYYSTDDAAQTTGSYGDSWNDQNTIGCYMDIDNSKMYWSKDGVIQNSGTGFTIPGGFTWLPIVGGYDMDAGGTAVKLNFGGCPATTISSAVADANGYGAFEYDPSDGGGSSFDSSAKNFLAVCTKNLAEYG